MNEIMDMRTRGIKPCRKLAAQGRYGSKRRLSLAACPIMCLTRHSPLASIGVHVDSWFKEKWRQFPDSGFCRPASAGTQIELDQRGRKIFSKDLPAALIECVKRREAADAACNEKS
jgi:hypothetical protein